MQVLFLQIHSTCSGRQAPIIRTILQNTCTRGRSASFLILLMMGAWRPKYVEWLCRNKICTFLHQVGVLFHIYYDARKHKSKIELYLYVDARHRCYQLTSTWQVTIPKYITFVHYSVINLYLCDNCTRHRQYKTNFMLFILIIPILRSTFFRPSAPQFMLALPHISHTPTSHAPWQPCHSYGTRKPVDIAVKPKAVRE